MAHEKLLDRVMPSIGRLTAFQSLQELLAFRGAVWLLRAGQGVYVRPDTPARIAAVVGHEVVAGVVEDISFTQAFRALVRDGHGHLDSRQPAWPLVTRVKT